MIDTTTTILTEEQEQIAAGIDDFMASSRQIFLVHGLAGTGKTMLLAHTTLQYSHASLCTLTGKAASILRRKTRLPAQTIPLVRGQSFFYNPDHLLTEIHRQAMDSPIIRQAHRVRAGQQYHSDGPEFRVARDGTDDDPLNAEVVLCWTNKTRHTLNDKCRKIRGYWQSHPQVGEPLMSLKNVGSQGIFNGAVYRLLEPFGFGDRDILIDVDGVSTLVRNVTFEGVQSSLPDHGRPPHHSALVMP